MKMISVYDSVGCILSHDVTQIIPGEFKGRLFKKGHIIKEEDIEKLLSIGKEHIYVWEPEEGQLHDSVELSKGMKDLIQVCMRMALIEAVYQEVAKPILILDDPFVNLDDVRLNNAVKLFKRISENYQMIYFICHDSRSV